MENFDEAKKILNDKNEKFHRNTEIILKIKQKFLRLKM